MKSEKNETMQRQINGVFRFGDKHIFNPSHHYHQCSAKLGPLFSMSLMYGSKTLGIQNQFEALMAEENHDIC